MTRSYNGPKIAIGILFPGYEGNETDRAKRKLLEVIVLSGYAGQLLTALRTYGNNEPTAGRELFKQFRWQFGRGCCNNNMKSTVSLQMMRSFRC